jgi:predicted dehydrogenase
MARLRGVCVGAGYFSRFHYDAWQRIDAAEIVSVCDLDRQKAVGMAEEFGIARVGTDVRRELDELSPDFIDIITPPPTHLELVTAAAERGIDIVCQKPLAPTFAEAQAIVETAVHAGVRLMVHENFRFQPWHREISSLLRAGAIGDNLFTLTFRSRMGDGWGEDAYLNRQPYFREMPRLLVFENGVHYLDTFRFLAGEIDGVYANLRRLNPVIQGEDCAIILIEFASGAIGLWDANRYNECNDPDPRYTFGEFLIEGEKGSIRLYLNGRLTVQPLGEPEREQAYRHERRGFAGDCVFPAQQHFIQCLTSGAPFETDGHDYLKTLRVQEAVYQSAESGQPIRNIHT